MDIIANGLTALSDAIFVADLSSFSQRWMITLLHFLWQGALVGGFVFLVKRLLLRSSASLRYSCFSVAFLALPVCVIATFILAQDQQPANVAITTSPPLEMLTSVESVEQLEFENTGPAINSLALGMDSIEVPSVISSSAQPVQPPIDWARIASPLVLTGYLLGVVFFLCRLMFMTWGGQRLRNRAKTVVDTNILATVARISKQFGLKSAPIVAWCDRIAVPTVLGVLRPTILLPASLVTGLDSNQLEAILSHELAHIRRYDLWMNLLQRVIESLLFFHPVVWYISRELSNERESCCDDLVVKTGHEPMQYAGALLQVAELCAKGRSTPSTMLAASGGCASQLETRIERLISNRDLSQIRLNRSGFFTCSVLLAVILIGPLVGPMILPVFGGPASNPAVIDLGSQPTGGKQVVDSSPEDKRPNQEEWTFEIVRGATQRTLDNNIQIKVGGLKDGEQSSFSNPIYTTKFTPLFSKNAMQRVGHSNSHVIFAFFENTDNWSYQFEIEDSQKEQFAVIENQFLKQVKQLVQSQLDSRATELEEGDNPWVFTEKQTAAIAKELIPLEIATEALALNVLQPHQQRLVLKEHFSNRGWQAIETVYGVVALGLNENQIDEIEKIISDMEANKNEARRSLRIDKYAIQKRLWEMIYAELADDQRERLTKFRKSYVDRLKNRTTYPDERYNIDGVGMQVTSYRKFENEAVVAEPCKLLFDGVARDITLYDHLGLGLDKLPILGSHRYLLGTNLSVESKEAIKLLQDEFLDEVAKFIKAEFRKNRNDIDPGVHLADFLVPDEPIFDQLNADIALAADNLTKRITKFAVDTHIKKTFKELSEKSYEILDETQKQILLENRLGSELARKGFRIFESSVFCDQLELDKAQQSKILELIKQANVRIASVESIAKKKLKDLDDEAENKIEKTVTKEQLEILDEIR